MAFCKGALSAVRKIWNSITPELNLVISAVTKYTKLIKDLESNPTVEALIKAIPGGSEAEKWLNLALDEITGVSNEVKTLSEKISEWLATFPSEEAKNAGVFKLASVASKIGDPAKGKSESFYDSAVQLNIMINKQIKTK